MDNDPNYYLVIVGLARFSESIVDYVANAENAPYPDITIDRFYGEISAAYDVLFNVWIRSNESKVINITVVFDDFDSCS